MLHSRPFNRRSPCPNVNFGAVTSELNWLSTLQLGVATYLLIWGTCKGLRATRVLLEDNSVTVRRVDSRANVWFFEQVSGLNFKANATVTERFYLS